jgi:hypothetical protein
MLWSRIRFSLSVSRMPSQVYLQPVVRCVQSLMPPCGALGQHQAHRAGRAGGTLNGVGEDGGVWQAPTRYVCAVSADLYAIESCRRLSLDRPRQRWDRG